jgi:LmbE family N-acetylglucosaminyl deacetylase/SAM-dependent methyltransferase
MTTFVHTDDGTPEEAWADAFAARQPAPPEIELADLATLGHLVVVAAHPDDETLGAAGLLARAYAAGVRTTVIVATSGEASHPESPARRPSELAALREEETVAAVASIDPGATVAFVRAPDGGLDEPANTSRLVQAVLAAVHGSGTGPAEAADEAPAGDDGEEGAVASPAVGDPEEGAAASPVVGDAAETALASPVVGDGTETAAAAADGSAPVAETWFVSPWSDDRHPDHAAAAAAVETVVGTLRQEAPAMRMRRLEYPVWLWHWGSPAGGDVPWDRLVVLPLDERTAAAKRAAMELHVSQVTPLSDRPGDEVLLHEGMLEHFRRPFEVFVEVPVGRAVDPGGADAAGAETADRAPADADARRYFDALHAGAEDPWGFESRWYEERKRRILVATLPDREYGDVLEIGTSTGVLSRELAERASARFVGVDVSEVAVERAAARNRDLAHASFERMTVPEEWPVGTFDLIVVSEVGYYLSPDGLTQMIDRALAGLSESGALVFCHWRHEIADQELTGDDVHAVLERTPGLVRLARHLEEDFVLDVVVRPPGLSVAAREGIV